jgi:hypothetical protein
LLDPSVLKSIKEATVAIDDPRPSITGTDAAAGTIAIAGAPGRSTAAAELAIKQLYYLIEAKQLPRPARAIRLIPNTAQQLPENTKVILVAKDFGGPLLQVVRGPWSTAGIGDEVVELFARQLGQPVEVAAYRELGQLQWTAHGVPVTSVVTAKDDVRDGAFVVAASAYFLATLPNAGSEALLSHLMVGAHARLAEDGRKAVAMMGSQQRASGEVLTMFANAIDREQRRIASFERFMPSPVDPLLHDRIADMQKDITGVWSSIGITPSPFVPPAERIRGRGGEDRRVPSRVAVGPLPKVELPTAFLKFDNVDAIVYELGNFVDGKRSISDIRDAVSSEFTPIALPVVVEYFERLAKTGAISFK